MKQKNIIARIWESIMFFITTIIGRETRVRLDLLLQEMARLNQSTSEMALAINKFIEDVTIFKNNIILSIKKLEEETKNKAHFPALINSSGHLINLSNVKKLTVEMSYSAQDKAILTTILFDSTPFDKYSLSIEASYDGSIVKPLFNFAGKLFSEYKREFIDECIIGCEAHLITSASSKEILSHKDIIEIIGQAIIGIARPYYIKENNLKDFDYNKGPVFKETLDQSPKRQA